MRHNGGFFYYVHFKDYDKAAKYFHYDSLLPDAPSYIKRFEIFCYQRGGEYKNAYMMWQQLYYSSHNAIERDIALKNILTITASYYFYVKGIGYGNVELFDDMYLVMNKDSASIVKDGNTIVTLSRERIMLLGKKWFKGDR